MVATQHWVYLQREVHPDMFIGPFPTQEAAALCMEQSTLVEGECEEDCTDCFTTTDVPPTGVDVVLVDHSDPHQTGAPIPEPDVHTGIWVMEYATAADSRCPDCGAPVDAGYIGLPDGDVEPTGRCTNLACNFQF